MITTIDDLVRKAGLDKTPVGTVVAWATEQWNRLGDYEMRQSIERDIPMLPAYRRNLENLWAPIERAAKAGWNPSKVSIARSMMERANTALQRLSEMVRIAVEKAKAADKLDRSYEIQLAGWEGLAKVAAVGLSTAAAIAAFIVGAPWIAAGAIVVGAMVALSGLAAEATEFAKVVAPIVAKAVEGAIEFSHSAVWIVAIVGAVAGLWFLSSKKQRRVA